MRVASPPPNTATGRGSSLGPAGPAQSRRSGQRNPSLSNVQEHGYDRPASRGSVNFSLPTSSRPGSPSPVTQRRLTSPSPLRTKPAVITSPTNQSLVYDPHTRSFLPRANVLAIEQRLVDASTAPVQKKKRVASQQATGTHLADGTVGGRLKGSAVDAMQSSPAQASEPVQSRQPIVPKPERIASPEPIREVRQKRRQRKEEVYDSDSDQASYIPNSSDTESDYGTQPPTFNTRAGALLAKKPSIVREDKEREEEEDSTPVKAREVLSNIEDSPVARTTSPTPLQRSSTGRGHGRGQASASAAFAQGRQHTRSASQPAPTSQESFEGNGGLPLTAKGSIRGGRVQSVSPARTTHFASTPDSLMVKHTPPARSISPRKSALKSPRGVSPNPSVGFSNASNQSEASEDMQVPRKKAVRVSFDEANVAVGQAAPLVSTDSPMVASPQAKRSWFSMGRGKKKESSMADEDDEVMKPRPALPFFGSVREKKPARDSSPERPLMRPKMSESEDTVASPLFTSPTGESFEYPLGISNDHVVGTVLAQDASMKNAANISKSREPLPPQVTSVEGNGYLSDSSSIASREESKDSTAVDEPNLPGQAVYAPIHVDTSKAAANNSPRVESLEFANHAEGVPGIAITTATPTLGSVGDKGEWLDMPGGWRQANSDTSSGQDQDEIPVVEHRATDPTPAEIGIAEPTPEVVQPGSPVIGDIAAENSRHSIILEESDNSDNDSIYSDAAEDLSDVDGDGFMSLDAVVESPIVPSSGAGTALTTPPDTPTSKATKERAYRQSGLVRRESEPDADQGWEKAQEYWKSLSVDKKKKIEEEARIAPEESERGVDVQASSPKPKKKKTPTMNAPTTIQTATRVASPEVPEIRQPVPNSQRTYMIAPGTKHGQESTVLRSSLRGEPQSSPADTHIRKSMRGDGLMRGSLRGPTEPVEKALPMRSSLRNSAPPVESKSMRGPQRESMTSNEQRGALQKKHRPLSHGPDEIRPDPAAVDAMVKKLSASKPSSMAVPTNRMTAPAGPTLRRKSSADSDSSFRRARGSNDRVSNDIPNFRSSMRGSRDDGARAKSPTGSSRFSLRTMSPTPSTHRRAFSSSAASAPPLPQTHMRNSMRNSAGPAPTLRGAPARTKSPLRMPGFGRSFGTDKAPPKRKPVGQRSSRFDDSSDEEDARPSFRSRFNDSSDEDDEPAPRSGGIAAKTMRSNVPVRGIPKRAGAKDGDSSDLPDSDDEKPIRKTNGVATKQPPVSMEGGALASGSLRRSGSGRGTMSPTTTTPVRPDNNRRGSFMSILRRKKDPSSKVRKSELESAARRDTPLERSKSDLANLKAIDRPTSPRLQKRSPMSRQNSGAWPIVPPPVLGIEEGRPFSADAANGITGAEYKETEGRPSLGSRRHTASGLAGVDLNVANGNETGTPGRKKKKFQALRKMFRLDD
jgi:serine/arginine repetitive matrix protein 2